MAQPNTPVLIPQKAQEALLQYIKSAKLLSSKHWNMRDRMRKIDLDYMREVDNSTEHARAKASNNLGDQTKFQNITVPVVMPQVESAVTYQSSVFLQGYPIFGVMASPQSMDEALQLETIIEDQSTRGGWVAEFIKALRDGFKYNLAACEVNWNRQVTAALDTDINFDAKQAKPREVIWEGNAIKRWNLYNTFWDMRVAPTEVATKGEFVGNVEAYSRIALKQFIQELPDKLIQNIVPAFESGCIENDYYIPSLDPEALDAGRGSRESFNWLEWASLVDGAEKKINYKDILS